MAIEKKDLLTNTGGKSSPFQDLSRLMNISGVPRTTSPRSEGGGKDRPEEKVMAPKGEKKKKKRFQN